MSDLKLSVIISAVDRMTQPVRRVMQSTDRMTESVRQQRGELSRLGRTRGDINHFRQLRQSTSQSSRALNESRAQATQLGRTLSRTTNPTAKMRREFDQARRSVQTLQSQHQAQQQQLQQLRTRLRQAGVSTRNLGRAQRQLRTQSEQTTRSLERQQQRLQRMQNARANISRGMATSANMMFVGYGAAQVGKVAAGMLSSPISTAAGFEEAMSGVGAVSRANAEQLGALTAKAKELGATTRYSAVESAAGMKYLAMAGFSTEQIMSSLPGVMNLATAGATDLGRASDISSDILSAFGLRATDMGRVSDTLTATFTRSNTSLEMLGETMKYVGPVARGAGMGLEETAAMAGLLGNVGIKASQAGTTLRAMLQRLAAPTGAAATTLRSLGVEVQDLDGNVRSVPQILGELAAATEDMGSGERLGILKTLFEAEAAAGVSELIAKQGSDGITQFVEILKGAGGEAARVAKQMDDNASGGFKAMNSAVEGLKISFGDLLLPAVRSVTKILTGLTRRMSTFTEAWPNLSRWLGYGIAAIAGLAFVFSGLMMVLSGVIGALVITKFGLQAIGLSGLFSAGAIKGLAMSFIGLAGKAIPAAIVGIRALGVAVMANPIGFIIGGIALAAGLIIANWGSLGSWFGGLWDGITRVLSGSWDLIKTLLSFTPLGLVISNWDSLSGWFGGLWDGIASVFSGGWNLIKTLLGFTPLGLVIANWDSLSGWFGGLWDGITSVFSGGWDLFKAIFSFSPLGLIIKAWKPMLNWISDKVGWISEVMGGIKGFFGGEENEEGKKPKGDNNSLLNKKVAKQAGMAAAVTAAAAATPVAAAPVPTQQTTTTNQYTLQIIQQPGEDSNQLAEQVMEKIKQKEAMQRQGAQYDYD